MDKRRQEEARARCLQSLKQCGVPAHMHDGVINYLFDRLPPGGFMTALLSNDFMEAAARADEKNQRALMNWATWLYNHAPRPCYGSPEAVEWWLKADNRSNNNA